MEDLLKKQQKIKFSGSGASHQNGSAERAIQVVVTTERIMLMHSALRCPEDSLSTDLWPTAMDYSECIYNWIHDIQSWSSTIEIWSRSRFDPVSETLSNFHVWGFLTYFLEPKLQIPGVKIPKWDTRSQIRVNWWNQCVQHLIRVEEVWEIGARV